MLAAALLLLPDAEALLVLLPDEPPQASSTMAAMPAAPPDSAVRRVIWRRRLYGVASSLRSSHSRRSIASPKYSDSDTLSPLQIWLACAYAFRLGRHCPHSLTDAQTGGDCIAATRARRSP